MRLILLLLALSLLAGCDRQKQAPQQGAGAAEGSVAGLDRGNAGARMPAVAFSDPAGRPVTLAHWAGRPLLVNLWATWCAPCVKELPTLAALAARPGAPAVLAVSQDSADPTTVREFLKQRRLTAIAAHQDPPMALSGALGVTILPTTVLYGADGREIWRFVGDADWTSRAMLDLLAEASVSRAAAR